MLIYIAIQIFLWVLFGLEFIAGRQVRNIGVISVLVFVLFAGLRFETGNDWLVYRELFYDLGQIGEGSSYTQEYTNFELLYLLLNAVFSYLIGFQAFIFLVSAFNGWAVYWFCRQFRVSAAGVVSFYFGLVYLATQMAAIRHSLAVSLVMLTFGFAAKRRYVLAALGILVAMGFHVSSVMFVPLLFLIGLERNRRILVGGFVFAIFLNLMLFLILNSDLVSLPLINKLVFYSEIDYSVSLGAIVYIVFNAVFLVMIGRHEFGTITRLAYWGTAYLLLFQIALVTMPIFWNRLQPLIVIFQGCYLSWYIIKTKNLMVYVICLLFSTVVLFRQLSDPAFISYVPYQDVVSKAFDAEWVQNDGEYRFQRAIEENLQRGKD